MNKLTATEKQFLQPLNVFEKSQNKLVKENPFIEIKDNESFELAKKSRTALLKGRTELQNQQTAINKKVNSLKNIVKTETDKLIEITAPAEQKQQIEVKRYENIKETERLERERIKEEKETKIKGQIDEIMTDFTKEIDELKFDKMVEFKESMTDFFNKVDTSNFEDLDIYFSGQLAVLNTKLDGKCSELQKDHDLMVAGQQNRWNEIRNNWNERFMNVTAETIGKLNTDFDTTIPDINSDDFGTFGDDFVEWSKKMRDLIGNKQIELQKEVDRIKEEKIQEEKNNEEKSKREYAIKLVKEIKNIISEWFDNNSKLIKEICFEAIPMSSDSLKKSFDNIRSTNFYQEFKEIIELKIEKLERLHKDKCDQLSAEKIKFDKAEKIRLAKEKSDKKKNDATEKARQKKLKPFKEFALDVLSGIIFQKQETNNTEIDTILENFRTKCIELRKDAITKINEL